MDQEIPKLDQAYYFRQLQSNQIENIIINLTKQEENDTHRLQSLILSHYAAITQSFDLLKDINKDADALSQTILSSFTGSQDKLNESTVHQQSSLFVDLDRSLSLFQEDSAIVRVYQDSFDQNKVAKALYTVKTEIKDSQVQEMMMDVILSELHKHAESDNTANLLEQAYLVLDSQEAKKQFGTKVVSSFLKPLVDELEQASSEAVESEKQSLLSEVVEPFEQLKQYVFISCQQKRIEDLLTQLSFVNKEQVNSYNERVSSLLELQMSRILEEQFNSFENTDVLLRVISSNPVRGSFRQLVELYLRKEVSSQLEKRLKILEVQGCELLNFRTMHDIKQSMLELEEFLIYDCQHLKSYEFFKQQLESLEMNQESQALRVIWGKVKKIIREVKGEDNEEELGYSGECVRLKNLLDFY